MEINFRQKYEWLQLEIIWPFDQKLCKWKDFIVTGKKLIPAVLQCSLNDTHQWVENTRLLRDSLETKFKNLFIGWDVIRSYHLWSAILLEKLM
jgi:hypothetical protein